ncbi:hypothetical protein [Streptomyces sp. DASNCL29]|uniref:hypothetical protein n=1 Tax=Streptomyces sp. DASNCL29 TaxID=2583819 RepID=UPI00110FC51F|nr:hypothetical protein [Streptomyces sp. DASNCL29]TMU94355.1 hypothetical protein FGK60_34485 [Streptomyces sp. DASNCL29]
MARRLRTPNRALAGLMQTEGIGNVKLARRTNAVGKELGITLHYDKSSVSQWLAGSTPKPQAQPAILEALSRLAGRPVTSAEVGWGDDPVEERDVVSGVMALSRADMDPSRRSVLTAAMYAATLVVPTYDELTGEPDQRVKDTSAGSLLRIGMSDVETVTKMTDKVAEILDEIGAGHARPMAAAFITDTIGSYLRADASDKVRKAMLAAVSDFVYLTGWMAMYEMKQGLGQKYYLRALDLAARGEDHVTYCRTLRGMSLQASHLGYGPKALELADAAAEAAPASGPRLVAFLRGQQAAAAAMTGDRNTAMTRLRETEAALAQADNRRDAVGGYDEAAFHFHEAHVRWSLKDGPGSIKALRRSNAARSPQERQGRVHCLGVIAQRQMAMRHIEAACATWNEFLDEHQMISSARGDEHLRNLRTGLKPYASLPAVRSVAERAREVAHLKAA